MPGDAGDRDARGQQPGDGPSEGLGLRDLTIYCPVGTNMAGIGRFYGQILGAEVVVDQDEDKKQRAVVAVGPQQTLTFRERPAASDAAVQHDDLRDEPAETPEGAPSFPSNYGPHVSMYVRSLPAAFRAADALGLVYVNPRFKRRAYTLKEAADQCMFRILDIVDPLS